MHFYTKDGVFLPGDPRVLPALQEVCVKFATRRGVNYMGYLFSSASIQEEGTAAIPLP